MFGRKISPYSPSETTPSWIRAPPPSIQADQRAARLQRELHDLDDLLAVHLAEAAAEHRDVLAEHADRTVVDGAEAGDDAVAVRPSLLHPERVRAVPGELVDLGEGVLVEQQLDPLACGLLAPGVLLLHRRLGAGVHRLVHPFGEIGQLAGGGVPVRAGVRVLRGAHDRCSIARTITSGRSRSVEGPTRTCRGPGCRLEAATGPAFGRWGAQTGLVRVGGLRLGDAVRRRGWPVGAAFGRCGCADGADPGCAGCVWAMGCADGGIGRAASPSQRGAPPVLEVASRPCRQPMVIASPIRLTVPGSTTELVRPGSLWQRIEVVDQTGSTNVDLASQARAGEAVSGSVLVTGYQSSGRGRQGRQWTAPPGTSVAISLLVAPHDVAPERWSWLSLLAGLAVVEGLRRIAEVEAELKWPNDVVVDDRKLCGILAERVDDAARICLRGGNRDQRGARGGPAARANGDLAGAAGRARGAVILAGRGGRARCLRADLRGVGAARRRLGLCGCLRRPLRHHRSSGEGRADRRTHGGGAAEAVDSAGRLVVRTPLGREVFSAGDVTHLR